MDSGECVFNSIQHLSPYENHSWFNNQTEAPDVAPFNMID